MKKDKSFNALKALGIGATVLGLVASLVSSFVEEKKTNALIAEKVNEAVDAALKTKDV